VKSTSYLNKIADQFNFVTFVETSYLNTLKEGYRIDNTCAHKSGLLNLECLPFGQARVQV